MIATIEAHAPSASVCRTTSLLSRRGTERVRLTQARSDDSLTCYSAKQGTPRACCGSADDGNGPRYGPATPGPPFLPEVVCQALQDEAPLSVLPRVSTPEGSAAMTVARIALDLALCRLRRALVGTSW